MCRMQALSEFSRDHMHLFWCAPQLSLCVADLLCMLHRWNPASHCCTRMLQVQIRSEGFSCPRSSHPCSLGTFDKRLGAFPLGCSFAAGNCNVQLQQRQIGNWTLPANASAKTQYDLTWSIFLPCLPYADNSATSGWSLRSEQVQISFYLLLFPVGSNFRTSNIS